MWKALVVNLGSLGDSMGGVYRKCNAMANRWDISIVADDEPCLEASVEVGEQHRQTILLVQVMWTDLAT